MTKKKPNTECCICKALLYRKPYDKKRFALSYCQNCIDVAYSHRAKRTAKQQYEKYIKKWKAGLVDGMRGQTSISSHIRRYLFEKHNDKCCKCGWSVINSFTGNVPLEVNHIDGDYKNNKESNLELLCPNCHSLTGNYKFRNRGKGRKRKSGRVW